ncbi:MAG: NADH-quinone oxidoreductase subunit N [Phycisphaerae bacterium]|nr:MAG: NADH-quinone oxidoreductase subunit N [Planctomycetota bacterium]KAB2939389.1 MAG: NADH-quinone oxidoreductase subunit N [Phycisphaerae bacterium]MBE7455047.1 NADH-quinone oxidoreductase subunit N [Planctomycetia bacterium]MCK6464719.1 NADH-quinone oxidoreductase subunit N [Phycisphaerae bacterium]MCL4718946.1 NADH-quinone oxidoreductase subunit N [Phycisphaerae bacterium]
MIAAASDIWAGIDIGGQLRLFSPEIALVATMLAIVTAPMLLGRGARTIGTVATLGVLAALVLVLRNFGVVAPEGQGVLTPEAGSGMLIADHLGTFFKLVLIVFLGGVTALWWMGSASTERDAPEFFILLLGSALGMALMVSTTNLLMMVIAIETASLPSYAIVGFNKRDAKGAEASLKYMVFGAISAATLIYGVSLLYGLTGGSLEIGDVARAWYAETSGANRLALGLGLIGLLVGIGFKISAVPLHFWCPDAFEGAKTEVTTWLSVASKAAGLLLLARVVHGFTVNLPITKADAGFLPYWSSVAPLAWGVGLMSIVTCTWANFAAYRQSNVKRMLAYSSIAHAGYMLMAGAVFLSPSAPDATAGMSALLTYIVIYMFMNLGAFGVVAMVGWRAGSEEMSAFTGLIRRAPLLAVPMIVCLVSLVGLPPFAGFIGKWWVLVALGRQGTLLSWVLITAAALNTLFSLYYYMRVVVQMTLRDDGRPALSIPVGGAALVNFCAVALCVLFVFVDPVKRASERYASGLFEPRPTVRVSTGDADAPALAERAP